MKRLTLILAALLSGTVALAPTTSLASDPNAEALKTVLLHFQNQCTSMQEYDIDAEDLDKPLVGKLTLNKSNIYELEVHTSGTKATVLYPDFHCENYGHPFCGSGGCGFYLIVDGKTFYRSGGFKPRTVTLEGEYEPTAVVVFGIHGGGCSTADDSSGAGVDPCYRTATWSDARQTFFSDGDIDVWEEQ